ncbi:MAG: extracellular solute-binding protein [bacterium]|nr:extracellular solute-binding protein [bacterium]
MRTGRMFTHWLLLALLLMLAACRGEGSSGSQPINADIPANAVQISIVYAPESEQYMPEIIRRFNDSYRQGNNPISGQALASGERPIYVTGNPPEGSLSSGGLTNAIVSAIVNPNAANALRPTMFAPSVSHWLSLANLQSGRQLFDLAEAQASALSPVVIAIWESRLQAIQQTIGREDIGWQDLLAVLESPNGWEDYGIAGGRRAVYYGHANPVNSSTALSMLIMEYYACARQNGFDTPRLEMEQVRDQAVQDCVREIERLVRHYAARTEDFLPYIAQGPDYLDFLAVEEGDIICLNTGGQQGEEVCNQPQERLVAIYPSDGTFIHEHPIGIVNADWVTPEQRDASRVFIDFVLQPPQQELIMSYGFRPANPSVPLGYPFVAENGVDPDGLQTIIDIPDVQVLTTLQDNWSLVRKQADIWLVMDVSGSMEEDNRLGQAQEAALAFLDQMEPTNRIGLILFSDDVEIRVPMGNFETNQQQMRSHIQSLRAGGGTELYGAMLRALEEVNSLEDGDRIRSIVLLSDGEHTGDPNVTVGDVVEGIEASRESVNPVIVIPVAYGSDVQASTEAMRALNSIARSSATRVIFGDPSNIDDVLDIISSYF